MIQLTVCILLTISLVLAFPHRAGAQAQGQAEQPSDKRWFTLEGDLVKDRHVNDEARLVVIDLARCVSEDRSLAWGLGSEMISVKGRKGNKCVVRHFKEIEGGYSQSECRVPVSIGKLSIYQGENSFYYSLDVSKHCKVIKTGNVFFDRWKP